MAEPRRIWKTLFFTIIDSINLLKRKPKFKGIDYNGTKYFETEVPSSGTLRKSSRFYKAPNDNFYQKIPPEWDSWLRHKRKLPPTEDEIEKNLTHAEIIKMKAKEIDKKKIERVEIKSSQKIEFPKHDEYELQPGNK